MAKRTPKSSNPDGAGAGAETGPKVRGAGRPRSRRAVASEMAAGQDQAGATADQYLGVTGAGEEPVQGDGTDSASSRESISMSSEPNAEDIRMRAYHRYLERGGGHGMDFEDWLEAERDLKSRR